MFAVAMVMYFVLFTQRSPKKNSMLQSKKAKQLEDQWKEGEYDTESSTNGKVTELKVHRSMEKSFGKVAEKAKESKYSRGGNVKDSSSDSSSDIAKHITMIRSCAAEGDLQGAVSIFNSLEQSGVEMNTIVYNTVLDACVECR